MNSEFFAAIEQLEAEKGIPQKYMLEKITQALLTAYKRDHPGEGDNIIVDIENGSMRMYAKKDVVEEVLNPESEISVEDAQRINARAALGDTIAIDIETQKFGRIAAQTAKQVIIQGIREAERGIVFEEYTSKEHEILVGKVLRVDDRSGAITLSVTSGGEQTEALLSTSEQVPGERYQEGDSAKVYVVEVRRSNRGPQVMVSRTHPGLVKRLFELEVPEIAEGLVEIKSIAREAGSRTKIAVSSTDEAVDAVGACVGPRGGRVGAVVDELDGEKIDIVKFSEDAGQFVASAISPAKVLDAISLGDGKSFRIIVPDDQLSLAIGKEGQNARLAARLTGCKIDIKPESQAEEYEEEQKPQEIAEDEVPGDEDDFIDDEQTDEMLD